MRLRKRLANEKSSKNNIFDKMKKIHNIEIEKLNQDAVTQYEESSYTIESKLENGDILLTELVAGGKIICSLFKDDYNPLVLNEEKI